MSRHLRDLRGAICALLAWVGLRAKDRDGAADLLEALWRDDAARNPVARLQNAGMVAAGAIQGGLLPQTTPVRSRGHSPASRGSRRCCAGTSTSTRSGSTAATGTSPSG
ncbi:hypothetical protein GCM10023175_71900 [Pseudonocardia xishanensis]|uniref:Uncharacterized protein n=1 Tax=Pseudonocardia xishanensis TaxID=630995 RepID=A0ABP8S4Z7_9PSEU